MRPFTGAELYIVTTALEDAITHNKLIISGESIPDTEEGDQPAEVQKAMGKVRVFARLSGVILKESES